VTEEKPVYNYFVVDYYETGCRRSIHFQISHNGSFNEEYEKQWKHFVNYEYYLQEEERLTEREFLDKYTRLLPNAIVHLMRDRALTIFQTRVHFNYS
jgi:hypothetical protein